MKIKYGELYVNKTWRFLAPSLKYYGEEFIQKFNTMMKLAVGIHDTYLDGSEVSEDFNIYILVDKLQKHKEFTRFMNFAKDKDYYVDSYSCDEIVNPRKIMIILRIPDEANNAYYHFLKGKYSMMYTREELSQIFNTVVTKTTSNQNAYLDYEILSKTGTNSRNKFVRTIKKEFGQHTSIPTESLINLEWELPLKKEEEIFNYRPNTTIFFNEEIDKTWR